MKKRLFQFPICIFAKENAQNNEQTGKRRVNIQVVNDSG